MKVAILAGKLFGDLQAHEDVDVYIVPEGEEVESGSIIRYRDDYWIVERYGGTNCFGIHRAGSAVRIIRLRAVSIFRTDANVNHEWVTVHRDNVSDGMTLCSVEV